MQTAYRVRRGSSEVPQTAETCCGGIKHRPHPEEHREAMRLEGWNESGPGSILRDGRARARPPQDEVRWISNAARSSRPSPTSMPATRGYRDATFILS